MKEIQLTQGKVALVDDEDFEWLNKWKWTLEKKTYAYRHELINGKIVHICMHRQILGLSYKDGKEGDHVNRNGLDNRRANLRIATRKENNRNLGLRSDNKSGFKGISFDRNRNKWFAFSTENGRTIYVGRFNDIVKAKEALDKYRLKNHQEFANDGFSCIGTKEAKC